MPKGTFDLAGEVEKILNEYGDEVSERMAEVVEKVAKKGVKQLKATSPVDIGAPKSGSYAKGWAVETSGKKHKQLTCSATIYNRQPGLPHLLEHGHALRQGGRSPAKPHIKPVEDMLFDLFRPEDFA